MRYGARRSGVDVGETCATYSGELAAIAVGRAAVAARRMEALFRAGDSHTRCRRRTCRRSSTSTTHDPVYLAHGRVLLETTEQSHYHMRGDLLDPKLAGVRDLPRTGQPDRCTAVRRPGPRRNKVVYVDKVEDVEGARMYSRLGRTVRPNCTGVGKVILAQLTPP